MAWVDFAEVKANVSMQAALARYNITLAPTKDGLRGNCPLPTHQGPNGTFSVRTLDNVWACASGCCLRWNGKRGGNIFDFVSAMERMPQNTEEERKKAVRDAALLLARDAGIGEPSEVIGKRVVKYKAKEDEPITVEPLPEEPEPVQEKGWLTAQNEHIVDALIQRNDENEGQWLTRGKKTVKAMLIESYENGKRAGRMQK